MLGSSTVALLLACLLAQHSADVSCTEHQQEKFDAWFHDILMSSTLGILALFARANNWRSLDVVSPFRKIRKDR